MKKSGLIIACIILMLALVGCASSDTSGDAKLYITTCALPGDGSNLMPGTFTLPNGTYVTLGSTIMEGDWLYTVGSAKVVNSNGAVDYQASAEEARQVCREALSNYLNSVVSTASARSTTNVDGVNSTKSGTESLSRSQSVLTGMEDCGFVFSSSDSITYIMARVNVKNVDGIETSSEKAAKKAEQYTDMAVGGLLNKLFR